MSQERNEQGYRSEPRYEREPEFGGAQSWRGESHRGGAQGGSYGGAYSYEAQRWQPRERDDGDRLQDWSGYAGGQSSAPRRQGQSSSMRSYGGANYTGGYGPNRDIEQRDEGWRRSGSAGRGSFGIGAGSSPQHQGVYGSFGGSFAGAEIPDYISRGYGTWGDARSSGPYSSRPIGEEVYGSQSRGSTWGLRRGGQRGKGPKGYKRNDQRIKEDVSEALRFDDDIDASNIEVEVLNGDVTLKGEVASRADKRAAEDVAENCAGVDDVTNQLRVRSSSRTSGSTGDGDGESDRSSTVPYNRSSATSGQSQTPSQKSQSQRAGTSSSSS